MELKQDEISELLRCTLQRGLVTYPDTRRRSHTATMMIVRGYMETNPDDVYNLNQHPMIQPTLKRGAKVWLTEKGKDAIRALAPDDFKKNRLWPLVIDVQRAQERLAV